MKIILLTLYWIQLKTQTASQENELIQVTNNLFPAMDSFQLMAQAFDENIGLLQMTPGGNHSIRINSRIKSDHTQVWSEVTAFNGLHSLME